MKNGANCEYCGKKYYGKKRQRFCSNSCSAKWKWKEGIIKAENVRGNKFKKGHITWNKGKHHSEETKRKLRRPISKETRKKRSLAQKGRKLSEETRKRLSLARRGKKQSKETKEKISEALKRAYAQGRKVCTLPKIPWAKGKKFPPERHYNWQGGKSFEPYGIEFNKKLKEQIRKRDNYTCQDCYTSQEDLNYKLSVHHIDFNKQNNAPNNLISLCKRCHAKTNFNKADWIKYFQKGVVQ